MTKEEILDLYSYHIVDLGLGTIHVIDYADALAAMSTYIAPLQAENEALRKELAYYRSAQNEIDLIALRAELSRIKGEYLGTMEKLLDGVVWTNDDRNEIQSIIEKLKEQ